MKKRRAPVARAFSLETIKALMRQINEQIEAQQTSNDGSVTLRLSTREIAVISYVLGDYSAPMLLEQSGADT